MRNAVYIAGLSLLLTNITTFAENWPQWRGPKFNGSTTEKNLPASFSKTENVAWSVDLPGQSAATPIIWQNKVFITSGNKAEQKLEAFCFDRQTGKELWRHTVAQGYRRDRQSNYASPSPTTDGQRVYFFYATGDLIAYDLDGKELWQRNIQKDYGEFAFLWTFATSPVLYDGKLFMQVLQRDVPVEGRGKKDGANESYVLALDPKTGKELWRQVRPSEAVSESREAFTTPFPYDGDGRKQLIVIGGDCLTSHDPATGRELWRWATWNPMKIGHWRLVPSSVAGSGIALACAPKGDPVYAIKTTGSGVLDPSAIAWKSEKSLTVDVPTPAFFDGDFFLLSDIRKNVSRVEAKTGKVKWTCAMPGRAKYEASPSIGDGKLYAMNFLGEVAVLDIDKGEVIQSAAMGESGDDQTRSAIALSQRQVFIRTNTKLYCVGKK